MTEWVSIPAAADRFGVSVDTIRRRLKRGELVSRKEPRAQGYVWQIEVESPPAGHEHAGSEQAPPAQDLRDLQELELVQLRERVTGLERERGDLIEQRNAWQDQARRSSDAEQQLRELVARAQMIAQALPATTGNDHAPASEPSSERTQGGNVTTEPRRGFWDWLRGK